MTSALSFLNDLAQWLGRWIPRLVLIQPTHAGALFGLGGSSRRVGPGLVVYWPITHALVQVAVTTQSVQLSAQVLPLDRASVGIVPHVLLCAAAVQFRVQDPLVATTRALHVHALIDNRAQAAVARHIKHRADLDAWATAVVADLRYELTAFGVVIERLDFTQHGIGVALKNVSDWNYSDAASGTRPS